MVVLHTLAPAEQLTFIPHDIFAVPFDDIAAVVGRSPVAARQLASRARRRVQGVAPVPDTDLTRRQAITDAFLTAARDGDFDALLKALDQMSWCAPTAPRRSAVRRRWPDARSPSRESPNSLCRH
jgi:RNA polymerase sigma-70 factor (ECF subfamily)